MYVKGDGNELLEENEEWKTVREIIQVKLIKCKETE